MRTDILTLGFAYLRLSDEDIRGGESASIANQRMIIQNYCRQNGIATGIATSNGREIVDAVIEALRLGPYLNEVATACEVAAGKPEPDIYLEVARRLKVNPEACLVFEDIPEGILAGKRAGMTVIAMADRFSEDMEKEKRDLADGFISDYRELLSR